MSKMILTSPPCPLSILERGSKPSAVLSPLSILAMPYPHLFRLWLKATGYGRCKSILKDAPTNQFQGKMGF
jgi:hypothetical protein